MWKRAGIAFRLNSMIVILLVLTCISVIIINATLSRNALEKEIVTRTLPAMASEVVAAVDRQLVAPATTLKAMASHPFLIQWILEGADKSKIPLIYQANRNVTELHNATGVSLVLRESLEYFDFNGGKEKFKKLDPNVDGWFFAFEKSGQLLDVNIHSPNDPHYANLAFINCRIDDGKGKFLGMVSVGMAVQKFNEHLAAMRIGEKGATFLVRKSGEIMLHPDVNLNGKNISELPELAKFAARALRQESDTFETKNADGERIWVASREIPILNAVVFSEANSSELLSDINRAWMLSAAAGLVILLVGFGFSTMLVRSITRPLRRIIQYAGDVAAERSTSVLPEDTGGEIGELLASINSMVDSIALRVREIRDKSGEAERQTRLAQEALASSKEKERQVSELMATMLRVSSEAEAIAEEVAGSSTSCADELENVNRRVTESDEYLVKVVNAMHHMQEQVEIMTASAATASESTEHANASASKGDQVLRQAITAIEDVNKSTDELRVRLESLGEKAASIGRILTVISDIADQTNLLALNAAIEAARAGDAGRGFAVVADEVRKLAEKTMEATREVDANIKDIQKATDASIEGMAGTLRSVGLATERAHESGGELHAIVAQMNESSSRVGEISRVAEEQKAGALDVINAVENSRHTTSYTIVEMQKVSFSVQSLAARANDLKKLVEELARSRDA